MIKKILVGLGLVKQVSAFTLSEDTNVDFNSGWYFTIWKIAFIWGKISCSGTVGAGAIFTVTLPDSMVMDLDNWPGDAASDKTRARVGDATIYDFGVGWRAESVLVNSTTAVQFTRGSGALLDSALSTSDSLNFRIIVRVL